MNDFPKLAEFLKRAGVNKETPADRIESLKIQYKQAYQAQYQLNRRKTTHRFTLRFSKQEFAELKQAAGRYSSGDIPAVNSKARLAPFIKKAVLAYISRQYLPRDEKLITALRNEIRAIGNNVNQVVNKINQVSRNNQLSGTSRQDEIHTLSKYYLGLHSLVSTMEGKLEEFMRKPTVTLKQGLWEFLQDQPEKVDQLISYLRTFKKPD